MTPRAVGIVALLGLATPAAAQTVYKNPVTVAYTPVGVVDGFLVQVDGGTKVDVGPATQWTMPPLANGPHTVTVSAYVTYNNGPRIEGAQVVPPVPFLVGTPIDPNCIPPLGNRSVSIFAGNLRKTGSGGAGSLAGQDFRVISPNSPITHVAIKTLGVEIPGASSDGKEPGYIGPLNGLWFTVPATPGTYPIAITASNLYGCTTDVTSGNALTVK